MKEKFQSNQKNLTSAQIFCLYSLFQRQQRWLFHQIATRRANEVSQFPKACFLQSYCCESTWENVLDTVQEHFSNGSAACIITYINLYRQHVSIHAQKQIMTHKLLSDCRSPISAGILPPKLLSLKSSTSSLLSRPNSFGITPKKWFSDRTLWHNQRAKRKFVKIQKEVMHSI